MDNTRGTNKPGYDKIALLGLFIAALLMAHLVVVYKSRLLFSDPIRLSYAGLSVSIPAGQSWQSEKQWQYRENMYSLSSLFPRGSDNPTAWVNCRYLLSAESATPQMRFKQKASDIDAVVTETNRLQVDTLNIDWVRIDKPEVYLIVFFGTARLPDNRQLDIELSQIAGDNELAERVFKRIFASLKFKDNKLLKTGAEIVAGMKKRGLDDFLDNQDRQVFFLIKDTAERTIGFTMDVLANSGTSAAANIRGMSLFYVGGQRTPRQGASFYCSNNLDEFVYKSEFNGRAAPGSTEIVLDRTGIMTVRKLQQQPGEENYPLNPAAIPDVFLDQLLIQMIDSKKNRIVVDIIEVNGKIIPTFIAAVEEAEGMTADQGAAYAFELELLDGRGFSERIYLNDQKQVYKMLVRQDEIYDFERTDMESIVSIFPEHAENVRRNNRIQML